MSQEFQQQYYMVIDEQSAGPFTLDEVILHSKITPDTLVWKPGLDNWVAAKTLPELSIAFNRNNQNGYGTPPNFNNSRGNDYNQYQDPKLRQDNPNNYGGNPNYGYQRDTYNNQNQYGESRGNNQFANNPQYQSNHSYRQPQDNPYYNPNESYQNRNQFRRDVRTNWMPWAIVATVLGLLCSCIGAIFGIIGIVQANKANNFYARDLYREGDAANSNAKIMSIIGLIFAGIGIIAAFWFGNLFTNLYNMSYL